MAKRKRQPGEGALVPALNKPRNFSGPQHVLICDVRAPQTVMRSAEVTAGRWCCDGLRRDSPRLPQDKLSAHYNPLSPHHWPGQAPPALTICPLPGSVGANQEVRLLP